MVAVSSCATSGAASPTRRGQGSPAPSGALTEQQLCQVWQRARPNDWARTVDGLPFRVLFPGRRRGGSGPDFADVLLQTGDGALVRGDLEVHVRSSQWYAHAHHVSPAFDHVILHAVARHDCPQCRTSSGRIVSGFLLPAPGERRASPRPCRATIATRPTSWLEETLDQLSQERLRLRAARLAGEAAASDPEQALWAALLECLGYPSNRAPMRVLARLLPYRSLRARLAETSPPERPRLAQALLLGTAGFLDRWSSLAPADLGDRPYLVELRRLWESGGPCTATALPWSSSGSRPLNRPARRLAAAASYASAQATDLADSLWPCLRTGVPFAALSSSITDATRADGYWADHADFARRLPRPQAHLVGSQRAVELAINALLPFALAFGSPEDAASALLAWRGAPPPQPNGVTRWVLEQCGIGPELPSANLLQGGRDQGLHHLYREYCTQGACGSCPLSSPTPGARREVQPRAR